MPFPQRRITKQQEQGESGQRETEKCFAAVGWQPRPLTPDLGEDFIVDIYDDGISAGLAFYVQVKSIANASSITRRNEELSYSLEIKDLEHWEDYRPTVVLLIWDIANACGYWELIENIISKLNANKPTWRTQKSIAVRVPFRNTTDKESFKRLRRLIALKELPTFGAGKELTTTVTFSFPDTDQGKYENKAIQQLEEYGDGAEITTDFITKIEAPDWYQRKFGKIEIASGGTIKFGTCSSDKITKFRLKLLSPQQRVEQILQIETKPIKIGSKRITFSNAHNPLPFNCQLVFELGGNVKISFSLNQTKLNAHEAFKAFDFFNRVRPKGTLYIEPVINTNDADNWDPWKAVRISIPNATYFEMGAAFRKLLERMKFIEEKTSIEFDLTSANLENMDGEEWKEVHRLAQITEMGRLKYNFKHLEWDLSQPKTPDAGRRLIELAWKRHRENTPIVFHTDTGQVTIHTWNSDIPVGPQKTYIQGLFDEESLKYLVKTIESGESPQELSISLVNGLCLEEYTDWIKDDSQLKSLRQEMEQQDSGSESFGFNITSFKRII